MSGQEKRLCDLELRCERSETMNAVSREAILYGLASGRKTRRGGTAAHPLPEERKENERLKEVPQRAALAAVVLYLPAHNYPRLVL